VVQKDDEATSALLESVGVNLFLLDDAMQVLPLQAGLLSSSGDVALILLKYGVYVMTMKSPDDGLFCLLEGEMENGFIKIWRWLYVGPF
jgi:hypothetical protein